MENNKNYIDDIAEIRKIMEKSSRFISLSGLSGISAGIVALVGAAFTYFYFNFDDTYFNTNLYFIKGLYLRLAHSINFLIIEGVIILVLAVSLAILFTVLRARKNNLQVWDKTTKRLLINLAIPLLTGGLFCLALIYHQIYYLIAQVTLVFYGLALLNASKYTLNEIRYLGIIQIILGLLSSFLIGYGLVFWAIGFGLVHIIYGAVMYYRYERNYIKIK